VEARLIVSLNRYKGIDHGCNVAALRAIYYTRTWKAGRRFPQISRDDNSSHCRAINRPIIASFPITFSRKRAGKAGITNRILLFFLFPLIPLEMTLRDDFTQIGGLLGFTTKSTGGKYDSTSYKQHSGLRTRFGQMEGAGGAAPDIVGHKIGKRRQEKYPSAFIYSGFILVR
jgi:hypothetical protein